MSLKKDKQKVLGENFDAARINTFFDYKPYDDTDPDYHLLEKAYRGMKSDNFATFISFFTEKGHNLKAKNLKGETFLETIANHSQSEEYIEALKKAGA